MASEGADETDRIRIKAEINRSCTPEQARAIRKVLEDQGWREGVDFIDHTEGGTRCYSEEEMQAFKEELRRTNNGSTTEAN